MQMIHCPRCGAEIPPGSVFCSKCGTRIPALSQESPSGFNLSRLKKAAIPLGTIAVVSLLVLAMFPGEQNPCEGVFCNDECRGTTLWKMKCAKGECVPDYPLEKDSDKCGISQTEDPCKDVICYDECFGTTLWKMRCWEGECKQASIIESNSTKCGYTPPPTPSPSPPSQPVILIKICSAHYDAPGNDHYNLNEEWIKICNEGNQDVNISRWKLYDLANHVFTFPSGFVLRAGKSVIIYSGKGLNTESRLYWGRKEGEEKGEGAIWNNDGDCACLVDDQGDLIDIYCW